MLLHLKGCLTLGAAVFLVLLPLVQGVAVARALEVGIFYPGSYQDTAALGAFEKSLGLRFYSAKWYSDWSEGFDPQIAQRFHNHGLLPELTWQPKIGTADFSYNDVLAGRFDSYLDQTAQRVKGLGFSIRISLAPEMNASWTPWSVSRAGNNNESHKAFWRHVVQRFRANGVSNVQWVWSPNIHTWGEPYTYAQLYPGDDYVDFVGLDGYNWGTSASWSTWTTFRNVFLTSYQDLIKLTNKNVLIMEVASTELGGNKAQWISDMGSDLQRYFPRIQGFTWFHMNKETDWRINSSPSAQRAFAAAFGPAPASPSPLPSLTPSPAPTPTKKPSPIPRTKKTFRIIQTTAVAAPEIGLVEDPPILEDQVKAGDGELALALPQAGPSSDWMRHVRAEEKADPWSWWLIGTVQVLWCIALAGWISQARRIFMK